MKQTNTLSAASTKLLRMLLLAVLVVIGTANGRAADKTLIQLELNKDYALGMDNTYYYYEATETGRIQLSGNSTDLPALFSDDTFSQSLSTNISPDRKSATFNVEAGKTYYLLGFSLNSGSTFRATLLPPITSLSLAKATPEAGTSSTTAPFTSASTRTWTTRT